MRTAAPILCAALLWAGCGDDGAPETPANATYVVEGVVETLPRDGADRREITIAHDDVPGFVNREGEEVGMNAMTMQFVVASDVDLASVATGDRVEFTFEVRWDERPMLYITRLDEM